MKRNNIAVLIMYASLGAIIIMTVAGCDRQRAKMRKNTPFACIPYECKIVGKINIAALVKIEEVSKNIEKNEQLPCYKRIKAAGLDVNNIDSLTFGIDVKGARDITKISLASVSESVFLINTKNRVNIASLIQFFANDKKDARLKEIKIDNKTVYVLPGIKNNISAYISQLNDTTIAISTEKYIAKVIDLNNDKGQSILSDKRIMELSHDTNMSDMLWVAAIIPDHFDAKINREIPKMKDGVVVMNYLDNCLKISGLINCATKEEAQKALLPFQMISFLVTISSNSTFKTDDFSVSVDNTCVSFNINLTKEILSTLLAKNMQKPECYKAKQTLKKLKI